MNRISRINYERFTTVLAFSIYINVDRDRADYFLFIKGQTNCAAHLHILTSRTGSRAASCSPSEARWLGWGQRGPAEIRLLFAELLQTITGLVSISEKWENCILFLQNNNNTTSRGQVRRKLCLLFSKYWTSINNSKECFWEKVCKFQEDSSLKYFKSSSLGCTHNLILN